MAKKVNKIIKLQIPAGAARPGPPIGPALGAAGAPIPLFCKEFNARTQAQAAEGLIIPTVITVYTDRSFKFELKTPPVPVWEASHWYVHVATMWIRCRASG